PRPACPVAPGEGAPRVLQVVGELVEAPESTSGGSFWARAPTHSGRLAGRGDAGRVQHGGQAAGRATLEVATRATGGSVTDAVLDPQATWPITAQPAVSRPGPGGALGHRLRQGRQRLAD